MSYEPGILLPAGIVQPFDLRYTDDDIHVIASFEGHAAYEAVEAMIRVRGQPRPRVRAILTRHDQTQVDHVNDRAEYEAAQDLAGRTTVRREVDVAIDGPPDRPRVTVRFTSFAGEEVCLCVVPLAPADAARGGLTDPGGHAAGSSLPLMWRERSGLAGADSSVTIAGVACAIRERFRLPTGAVGLQGFYTEGFRLGAIRASQRTITLVEEPRRIEVGSSWRHETDPGGQVRWVVTRVDADGRAEMETDGGARRERVWARIQGGSIQLLRVELLHGDAGEPGFALRFLPGGCFAMDVANNAALVTGAVAAGGGTGARWDVALLPREPAWAASRRVRLQVQRLGREVQILTSVG